MILRRLAAAIGLFVLAASAAAAGHGDLVALAQDWRRLAAPTVTNCLPDYSVAAMAAKAKALRHLQARLHRLDRAGRSVAERVDYQLIEAEMNGLDFDLRVLRPWARDPSFYATLFAEQSDVPAHEGSAAQPNIDLFDYEFPLSAQDQARLTCQLAAVPRLLAQARDNLKDSNAADLWRYGGRAFREQSAALAALEAGTLSMRTLAGPVHGSLESATPALVAAVRAARQATDAFAAYVAEQAPAKTGPSGVGKANYDWYEKHVHLLPYDWRQQETLLTRELARAEAGLRLEEFRNRALPPLEAHEKAGAFEAFAAAKMARLTDFLIGAGIVEDRPYYRDALAQQVAHFVAPGQRNFFEIGIAFDPLPLYSHDYHWIELARRRFDPPASPIRRLPILSNMFDARSEGLATAMEELLMQAGLYDDDPRGREIVWIMLANRAARGLASLHVQANEMSLREAGRYHARWTPRGWSDPASDLVAFEQLLYLRQPGYGTSYITGKLQFEQLLAQSAHQAGGAFDLADFFARFNRLGVIPFALAAEEMAP